MTLAHILFRVENLKEMRTRAELFLRPYFYWIPMKNRTFERFFKSSSSFVSIFFFKGAEFRDTVEREELKKCLKFSVSS